MDQHKKSVIDRRIKKTVENLQKNNMQAFYAATKEDAVAKVAELLSEGAVVSGGGSMSLYECGVVDLLRSGKYDYRDRDREGITLPEREQIQRDVFSMDAFLCSSNAVTEKGELYNVDGNGNRVAAITWGPKSVIIVVSCDKIVKDIDEAVIRVKKTAAPANVARLSCETYCAHAGECMSCSSDPRDIPAGCGSDDRICCHYLITGRQRHKDRIKVILVGEELGY